MERRMQKVGKVQPKSSFLKNLPIRDYPLLLISGNFLE